MSQEYPEIMHGDEASTENFHDRRNFVEVAREKHDIVRGFLKEKEIIDVMHKEKINELKTEFEQEKHRMWREFELEKKELLEGFDKQQVKTMKEIPQEIFKTGSVQELQLKEIACKTKYKEDRVKMARDYEEILVERNEEIQMLRRELLGKEQLYNALCESCFGTVVYGNNSQLEDELRRASEKFEIENFELRRKFDREKAELVQSFADQTEKMNTTFEYEKARMQKHHNKEIEFKLDITEKLFSEKADIERTRMVKQFEREIAELHKSLETHFNEDLLEKQEVIDSLEKENAALKIALQAERFGLARIYNREMSLLTKPDSITNEDLEVALIDEIAKVRQQNDEAVSEMERKHQKKVAELKRSLKPLKDLEATHRSETERLKKNFENEKEGMEAEFRVQQLNLLKSFEFERNDLKNRYEENIYEKELEMQQREDDLKQIYEGKIYELKRMVDQQREELELSKKQLVDMADQMKGFLSEKTRLLEPLQKEENQYQSLKQTLDKNLMEFENGANKNEETHKENLQKILEEAMKEKEQLQNKQERLEEENKELKAHLEDLINMSPEKNRRVDTSQNDLESSPVVIAANPAISVTASQQELNDIETEEHSILEKKWENNDSQNEQINNHLRKVRENLLKCISEKQEKLSRNLEHVQTSNKHMKDVISEQIVEIDTICAAISRNVSNKTSDEDKRKHEEFSRDEQVQVSLRDQLRGMQNFLDDDDFQGKLDKSTKYRMNKRLYELTKQIARTHEFEKLKAKSKHQHELNQVLKELADEKRKTAQFSVEGLQYRKGEIGCELKCTGERGTSTDDRDDRKQEGSGYNEKKRPPSDAKLVQELRRENEQMRKYIAELQKRFIKEKEEIIEKLHTQHKEFVMNSDEEIIENLLKEKLALEESFNLERFYLSKLYYLEMKDDLEETLSKRTHQMKREFHREKMEIILKYESDITDLHNLLSEKDNMELKLLQDRKATVKLLTKKKMGCSEKEKKKEMELLEIEKANLDATISLRKEIAELQKKRYQEHETAAVNLKEAINLIKDLMTTKENIPSEGEKLSDRFSFASADLPTYSEKSVQSQKAFHLLLPDDEIRNRDELKNALENLVEVVLNDNEESLHDSETTSGASSDLELEDLSPTPVNEDSDEGAYSGAESADGDVLNIKKAKLDFVFNLERFNLGRVYNNEYRDSLKRALRKLAKAKDSIRSKHRELENDMIEGIKNLVQRTQFGNRQTQIRTKEKETQTVPEKEVFKEKAPQMTNDSMPLRVGPNNERSVVETKSKAKTERKAKDDTDGKQVQEECKVNETNSNENTSESKNNLEIAVESALVEEPNMGKDKMHPNVDNESTERSCKDLTAGEETEEEAGDNDEAHENGNGENDLSKLGAEGTKVTQHVCAAFQDSEGEENTEEQIRENVTPSQLETNDKKKETGTKEVRHEDGKVSDLEVSHMENVQLLKEDNGILCLQENEKYTGEEKIPSYETEKDDTPGKVDTDEGHETNNEREQLDSKEDDTLSKPETKKIRRSVKGSNDTPWPREKEMEKHRKDRSGAEEPYKSTKNSEKAPKTRQLREIREQETKDEQEERPLFLKDHNTLNDRKEEENDNDRETLPGITLLSKKEALGFNDPSKKSNPCFDPEEIREEKDWVEEMTCPLNNENVLIKMFNTNRRDKFSLLCGLVGIGFVKEIPELNEKNEEMNAGLESVESKDDLLAKREEIDKMLQQIELKINELSEVDKKNLNRHQHGEELKLLQSLEEVDKKIRRNDEKDLVEHLLIEKEKVLKKLDEINIQLKGEKESTQELASTGSHTLQNLMTELDLLKDEKSEKIRQLNHKSKMLEDTVNTAQKEKQELNEVQCKLRSQILALDRAMDSGNEQDQALGKLPSDKELPMDILILLRKKVDANRKAAKLTNDVKRSKREIDLYNRILEGQRQRLLPFKRKKVRLLHLLDDIEVVSKTESESRQHLPTKSFTRNVSGLGEEKQGKLQSEPVDANSQLTQESKQRKKTKRNLEQLDLAVSATGLRKDEPNSEQVRNVSTTKSKIQGELTDLENKIVQEQVKMKEAGFNDLDRLMRVLEDGKKIQMELAKMESSPSEEEELQELPGEENLKELLLHIENLQESLGCLDNEISREQQNCLDALHFQRDGNLKSEVESEIKELIKTKDKLVEERQKTSEILQSVSSVGLMGHQSTIVKEYIEKKMKLEEEIDISQNKIDDEPMRAIRALINLLEKKSAIDENLRDTTEKACEEVNRIQNYVSCNNEHNNNSPDRLNDLIVLALSLTESVSNENLDAEERELNLDRKHLEGQMKEKAMKVVEAKRLSLSPAEDVDCLKQVITEKVATDSEFKETRDNKIVSKSSHAYERKCYRRPASISDAISGIVGEEISSIQHWKENKKEKRQILEERLFINKNELETLVEQDIVPTDDFDEGSINLLETLVGKKMKLEEELRHFKNLKHTLHKKQEVEGQHNVEDMSSSDRNRFTPKQNLANRLSTVTDLIQRREIEQQRKRTNLASKEKSLEQLEKETIELEKATQDITDSITEAKMTLEAAVVDVQKDIEKHGNCDREEEDALRQEIEGLRAEINSLDEREKELINELRQYQKELTRWKNITPGNALDLEEILKEKETLRNYIDELDRTLDKCQVDHTDALTFDEIEELMKQRRDLKARLHDLEIEKAKFDVEFEDKEIKETRAELMQQKKELEEIKHEVSNEIVHSGKFGKFVEKAQNSDITPIFVKNVLHEMVRNEKSLIEVIKDHEDLRNVSQRQRKRLENLHELVKSKVGEDLIDVLTSHPLSKNNPNSEVLDRVEVGEETVSEILNDLCEENMQLRKINDELNAELDILKGKIGDELADELLRQGLPARELEFADVISTVNEDEITLAEVLKKQKEEVDFLEDKLGKNLSDALFEKEERRELRTGAPAVLELIAPAIMKTFDEDLESVIAAYERELVYLSNESSVLKKKLGDALVNSLLQTDLKPRDNFIQGVVSPSLKGGAKDMDHGPAQENTLAVTDIKYQATQEDERKWMQSGNETTYRSKTNSGTDSQANTSQSDFEVNPQQEVPVVEKPEFETRKEKDVAFEENPTKLQESTIPATRRAKYEALKQDYEQPEDLIVQQTRTKNRKRTILENALFSYYIGPNEQHPMPLTKEEKRDDVKPLKAPIIMRKWDRSLGEIIAQYEQDLEKFATENKLHTAGFEEIMAHLNNKGQPKQLTQSGELQNDFSQKDEVDQSDLYGPDSILDLDTTIHKILDAQDKSMEILRVLKERLGDDLVYALLGTTNDPRDYPLKVEDKLYDQEDVLESKTYRKEIPDEKQVEEGTGGEEQEIVGHSDSVQTPKEDNDSNTSIAEEKPHPDLKVQLDDKGRTMRLKAPSIALKNKKTLAEVIASYEEGFSSLESKIGPSLTKSLLEMEGDWICDENETLGMTKGQVEGEDFTGERTVKPKRKETVGAVGKGAFFDAVEIGASDQVQKKSKRVSNDKNELSYAEKTRTPINELRAPNIMTSKGKTLEEVIKDYEDRINDELNDLQNEIKHLKKNLTSKVPTNSENNKARPKGLGKNLAKEEAIGQPEKRTERKNTDLSNSKVQLPMDSEIKPNTLQDNLPSNGPITNEVRTVEKTPKTYAKERNELSEKAPTLINEEDKTLQDVLTNYEELEALRNLFSGQEEVSSVADIVKDLDDSIDGLEEEEQCERLVFRIGRDLANDEEEINRGATTGQSNDKQRVEAQGPPYEGETRLKAPEITFNNAFGLEVAEKALGLLPELTVVHEDGNHIENLFQDSKELMRENKILKQSLGENLAERLLEAFSSSPDSEYRENVEHLPHFTEIAKGSDLAKDAETKLTTDLQNKRMKSQLQNDGVENATVEIYPAPGELKAIYLVKDEGQNIENILKSYESELEALSTQIPVDNVLENSIADLVNNYDNKIEELESVNKDLTKRMDYLVMRIGYDLVNEIQNQQPEDVDSRDDDAFADEDKEGGLEVVKVLQNKDRTLQNIINNYEKELDALRKLEISGSTSAIVREYEDKLQGFRQEKEIVKKQLDTLEKRIGSNLTEDLKRLGEKCRRKKSDLDKNKQQNRLNAPNLMHDNQLPLEDIIALYEDNLADLKKETKTLIDGLGKGLANYLLQIEKEKTKEPSDHGKPEFDTEKIMTEKGAKKMRLKRMEETVKNTENSKNPSKLLNKPQSYLERENATIDTGSTSDLKAKSFMRDEGRTIEYILGLYEKELEAVSKLAPSEKGNEFSISDLIENYESKIDDLENRNKNLLERLDKNAESIAPGPLHYLESVESHQISEEDSLNASNTTGSEKEAVVANCQKEQDALENLIPKEQPEKEEESNSSYTLIPSDERGLIPDFLKKHEDKIDHLEKENKLLEEQLGRLETLIGPKLVEDLKKRKRETYKEVKTGAVVNEEVALSRVDTKETSEGNTPADLRNSLKVGNEVQIRLKAPEIMNENECALEEVVAIYEKNLEELNEETTIFKDSLGHSLAKRLIVMANPKAWSVSQEDNRELATLDNLKAITIMEDEGKSIENILRNYEEEMEALSKLVDGEMEQEHSVRNLVKKYEDNMENIEGENKFLTKTLEDGTEVTGRCLVNDRENLVPKETYSERYVTKDENKPETMLSHHRRNEGRTSENMVKNYETDLGAFKSLTPKDEREGSLADIVKDYEGKTEVLSKESESLRNSLDKLETNIRPYLVEQVKKLGTRMSNGNKTSTTAKENKEETEARDKLQATEIMEEKELTLEEVVSLYEKTVDNLKRQLDVLKQFLGEGLTASLLIIADERQFSTNLSEDHHCDFFSSERKQSMENAHLTKEMEALVAIDKTPVAEGLKAQVFIRDESKTIEEILKTYERQLETLSALVPTESGHGSSTSDLVENYQEKVDELQRKTNNWAERFEFLVKTIGPRLLETLEFNRTTYDEEDDRDDEEKKKNVLRAPSVMWNEDRTLENVVRNYETELDTLRKLIPDGNAGGEKKRSISEILKDYEAKIDGIEKENMTLTNHVHNLQSRIGPNLVTVLRKFDETSNSNLEKTNGMLEEEKTDDVELRVPLKVVDIMDKKDLTLEEIVGKYEKSIEDLERETYVLKEGLGNDLASWLLCAAKENQMLSQIYLDHRREAVFLEDVESRTTDGLEKQTETKTLKHSGQLLRADNIENPPAGEASQLDDLKAIELIRNEGKTVLNILKNYERKLDALSDLLMSEGPSSSELVVNYEGKIKTLESQNKKLIRRFDKLQRNIGLHLLHDIENLESDEMEQEEEKSDDAEDFHLQAPSLMRYEERTLENVVRNYEKELDVLRELVPGEKEKPSSISGFVKAYEDKVEDLKDENKRLTQILERLKKVIDPNLLEDLDELEKGTLNVRKEVDAGDVEAEREIEKKKIHAPLKASEITDEEVAIAVYEKEIEDLKRETKFLKDGIGSGLATCLLQMATMNTSGEVNVPSSSELNENRSANLVEDKIGSSAETTSIPQIDRKKEHDITSDLASLSDEMKAIALIRDEGRTVENILKTYEKKLESLGNLIPGDTKQEAALSNLPANDGEGTIKNLKVDKDDRITRDWAGNEGGHNVGGPFDTIRSLKEANRKLQREMKSLKEKFGEELVDALLRLEEPETEKKSKWRAMRKIKEEDTVLGEVLANYEREIEKLEREKKALETLVTDSEGGEGACALDVISQYEDEIEQLKERESFLEGRMVTLREKVGDILVDNILGLSDDEVVSQTLSVKALRIMDKEQKQLLAVIEEYENELTKLNKDDETPISLTGDRVEDGRSTVQPEEGYQTQKQEVQNNQIEDDFNTLTQGLGGRLVKEIINPGGSRKDFSLEALLIMERENKTLTDVVEQYEYSIKRKEREMDILKEMISADTKLSSLMDKILTCEDEIIGLNVKSKEHEPLQKKGVGKGLSRDLLALSEFSKRKQKVGLPLRAIEVMEKKDDKTIENVLEEYEENRQKTSNENEALKQLASSDVLETALSQKSEIDKLKAAKQSLTDDLDFVSAKIGKDFINELLKRSREEPEIGSPENDFHVQLMVRVECEEKPLIGIMEEYVGETKMLQKDREELCKVRAQMANISEKIGHDLFKEVMKIEGEEKDISPHMEVVRLMCEQKKQLAKVIEDYQAELARLTRENKILRGVMEKESNDGKTVLDAIYDYEEKIETLTSDNRELSEKSEKVGLDLTEELLTLRGGLINTENAPDLKSSCEMKALKSVADDQSTIADVLRKYEEKLIEFEDVEVGPLVSGLVNNEEVKLAKLITTHDRETKIPRSAEQPLHDTELLKGDTERIRKEDPVSVKFETDDSLKLESIKEVYKGEIRTPNNWNKTLLHKLHDISKGNVELSCTLTESPEGRHDKRGQSLWQPEAYKDTEEDKITSKNVLRGHEEKLKRIFSENGASTTEPWVEKEITKEEEIIAEVVREYESEPVLLAIETQQNSNHVLMGGFLCNMTESEVISHYGDPSQHEDIDDNKTSIKVNDSFDYQDVNNLDQYLISLGELVTDLDLSQTSVNNEDPELVQRNQEKIKEEIIKEEVPTCEEHCDTEYLETLAGEELSWVEEEVQCEMSETTLTENSVPLYDTKTNLCERHELYGLRDKVKTLEKELEEETRLKEKHEKDVQDLLNDIVEIKVRQAQDEDDSHQPRRVIKEDIEIKYDRETNRRLSLEENKRDLLDKVDSLMKERQVLQNEHGNIKDSENPFQDIIGERKTVATLSTRIEQLKKEVSQLKKALKDMTEEHAKQREQLLADCEEEKAAMMKQCEEEKAAMMKQLIAGRSELESQLQELLTMNDDLKRNIKNLHAELNGPIENTEENERVVDKGKDDPKLTDLITKTQEHLERLLREKEESLANEKRKNERLKNQLDETEDALKKIRNDYQGTINATQTEERQIEKELRQHNDTLTKRLQKEIEGGEQIKKDFEDILRKEKDHLREDEEMEYGRGKREMKSHVEDTMEDLNPKETRLLSDKQWSNQQDELAATYIKEKRDLQEAFDDELQKKLNENNKQLNTLIEKMRRDFEWEKNQMERKFDRERREIKFVTEKSIYEGLLSKHFAVESDFHEALKQILQEHNTDIKGVENEIREAEKRFEEDRIKMMEQTNNDKEELNKNHQKERQALESTVQNLLKEVVKLKHQRKEMRINHKKEKENIEEIYERDRLQLKEEWERYKRDLLNKLQEDFENKLAGEKAKFEASLQEMKQELLTSEKRRNELEGRLQRVTRENEDSKVSEKYRSDKTGKQTEAQLKSHAKNVEEEYEKKLMEEKRKFEETLQGLRREIESLQEKRRLIQDKVYNHDPSVADRQVIEKSIANYKKDLLFKMEEEVTQRIARERKPLDDTIIELEREIEDLKRQRWELGNQLRRERCRIEEEFDREKERMENQFLKEKEEMKNRLENIIQREMIKRSIEGKVSPTRNIIANVSILDDHVIISTLKTRPTQSQCSQSVY